MKERGAIVWLDGDPTKARSHRVEFPEVPRALNTEERSINYKETYAAIEGLERTAKNIAKQTWIKLAVDNTTAVSVLNRQSVVWDKELDQRLQKVVQTLEEKECHFSAIYTPGGIQPADEPSRLRPVNPTKVRIARDWLDKHVDNWWEEMALRQGGKHLPKRQRSPASDELRERIYPLEHQ